MPDSIFGKYDIFYASLLPVHADSSVRHQGPAESGYHSDNPAWEHHGPRSPADNRYVHGTDGPAADFLGKTGLGYLDPPAAGPADSHLFLSENSRDHFRTTLLSN